MQACALIALKNSKIIVNLKQSSIIQNIQITFFNISVYFPYSSQILPVVQGTDYGPCGSPQHRHPHSQQRLKPINPLHDRTQNCHPERQSRRENPENDQKLLLCHSKDIDQNHPKAQSKGRDGPPKIQSDTIPLEIVAQALVLIMVQPDPQREQRDRLDQIDKQTYHHSSVGALGPDPDPYGVDDAGQAEQHVVVGRPQVLAGGVQNEGRHQQPDQAPDPEGERWGRDEEFVFVGDLDYAVGCDEVTDHHVDRDCAKPEQDGDEANQQGGAGITGLCGVGQEVLVELAGVDLHF